MDARRLIGLASLAFVACAPWGEDETAAPEPAEPRADSREDPAADAGAQHATPPAKRAPVVKLAMARSLVIALHDDGTVSGWGDPRHVGPVSDDSIHGFVDVPGIGDAHDIMANFYPWCAVRASGRVSCWSYAWEEFRDKGTADGTLGIIMNSDSLFGAWPDGRFGPLPRKAGKGYARFSEITRTIGSWATREEFMRCVELANGKRGCITHGGKLVYPKPVQEARQVTRSVHHACILSDTGTVSCSGRFHRYWHWWSTLWNDTVRPNNKALAALPPVVDIVSGEQHACALTEDGEVYCWGGNPHGQLGNGSLRASSKPLKVEGLAATQVVAGDASTCALRTDGEVVCWGQRPGNQVKGRGYAVDVRPNPIPGLCSPAECATRAAPQFVEDETNGPEPADPPDLGADEPPRVQACLRIMDAASKSACKNELCACDPNKDPICWRGRGSLAACKWLDESYGLPEISETAVSNCIAEVEAEHCGTDAMLGYCNDPKRPKRFSCATACDETRVFELCARAGEYCVLAGSANCG